MLLCGPFLSVLSLLSTDKMCGPKRKGGGCHLTIFVWYHSTNTVHDEEKKVGEIIILLIYSG